MLGGTLALVTGSVLGAVTLAGGTDRGVRDTVLTALGGRESLEYVKRLRLVAFDGRLLFSITKRAVYENTRISRTRSGPPRHFR